jgi:hypothetical protein
MNYFRFFCIPHSMGIFLHEKKFFFSGYTPSKIRFSLNYTTWQTSNFYSTDRVEPDATLEMKIKKTKKKIFLFEKMGWGPLNLRQNERRNVQEPKLCGLCCKTWVYYHNYQTHIYLLN